MPEDSKHELTNEVRRALDRSFRTKGAADERNINLLAHKRREGGLFSFLKRTDPRHVEAFTRELAILLGSGVDLLSGIQLLAGRAEEQDFKKVLAGIGAMVEEGSSFWAALSKYQHTFPAIYVSSVRAGESSGRLEFALEELCRFYEFEISAKKKIKTIVTYPVAVLILAVIVVIILSATILPVFSEMLAELGAETPFILNILYGVGGVIMGYWYVLVLLLAFMLFLPKLLRSFAAGEMLLDRARLKIPLFGRIFLRINISRFSRNLAILLASGVRITEALDTCAGTAGNGVVAEKLYNLREGIEKGESIESILKEPGVFPPLLVDMLVVGEHSGELEMVLNRVADVYEREAENSITTFASILEPALILSMGILVAFVFIALFLPYINLLTAMGGGF